jgi:UDP-glucose 4-epimerase
MLCRPWISSSTSRSDNPKVMSGDLADFTGQRAVVTGGAGFVGSHLVDALLDSGCESVAVVDNFFLGKSENLASALSRGDGRVKIYREDAAEAEAMASVIKAEKPDVVFNLATKALLYSFFNPAGACRVNIDIALTLGELLRSGAFGRLVHISTSEVYGSARYAPMDENHPQMAETSYAAGKSAADVLLMSYVNMFDLDITILRPFNNYGPRQNDGAMAAIIPVTIKRIRAGQKPIIQGDGKQTRDFIFVKDTVRAIMEFGRLSNARGRVLNLASGNETEIRAIVDTLSELLGYRGEYQWEVERRADVRRHMADVSRAEELIGPIARTELKTGLSQTVDWYGDNNP